MLLRTPHLVLRTIIDVTDPKDLIAFSMCSKRMWRLIKFHWNKKNEYELKVDSDFQRISFEHASDESLDVDLIKWLDYSKPKKSEKAEYVEIMGHRVLVIFGDKLFRTYWMDKQVGAQNIIDYVCDLFTMDVQQLSMQKPKAWFINFIKNRQTRPLNDVVIRTVYLSEEETELILKLKSNEMMVYSIIPKNFQFHGTLKYNFLHLDYGDWVTLDHLKNSEIIEFSIERSELDEHDINKFLKHLIAGGCPRLKFLSVGIYDIDIQNIFLDIQDKVIEVTEKRTITSPSQRSYTSNQSFDIRNERGTRYSICLYCLNTLIIAVQPGDFQFG